MRVIKSFLKTGCASTFIGLLLTSAWALPQDTRPRYTNRPDQAWTVPSGTVISMKMDSSLNSRSSRVGDKFTATVTTPVSVDGREVIPAGALIEGRVTDVTPARRPSKSGTIAVEFDDLVFPNGTGMRVVGSLTAADPRDRAKIDDESRVSGDKGNKSVVFIGGGAIVGAVLGGISGGGRGAAAGGAIGAGAGIAAVLLSKGEEAEVRSGSAFGVQLSQPLVISPDNLSEGAPSTQPQEPPPSRDPGPRDSGPSRDSGSSRDPGDATMPSTTSTPPESVPASSDTDAPVDLSSNEMMRRAQGALKDQGYYEGAVDGIKSQRTRTALQAYQHDHRLQETGELDQATAQSLGILSTGVRTSPREDNRREDSRDNDSRSGEPIPANVLGATATRPSRSSVHVVIHTQANTGGWRWDEEHRIVGDKLEILAVAIRPSGYTTQALTKGTVEVDLPQGGESITTVIVHSSGDDITIPLSPLRDDRQSAPPQPQALQPRVEALLAEYQRLLGVRGNGSRSELASNRYSDAEIEMLFALSNLANSVRLYFSMNASLESVSKLRVATLAIARDARRVDLIMTGGGSPSFQSISSRWDSIRQDVLGLMRRVDIRPSEIEWR